jgi:methionyl-tRNA synthetase
VFFKGERMSKSLGNIVDPLDAAKRFGPDPLRLYLTKEVPYGADGDFTWERFEEKYNADLANNLGNLVNRVASMSERYRQGQLAPAGARAGGLADAAATAVAAYTDAMERLALHDAAAATFRLVSATNEFVASSQPWALAKEPAKADQLSGVLYDAAEAVRVAGLLLGPFMPASSAEILRRMGETRPADALRLADTSWRTDGIKQVLNSGALWPRIEDKGAIVVSETPTPEPSTPAAPAATTPAAVAAATPAPAAAPEAFITIDDFMKVELRTAKILAAERLPKSKKLLKLSVDAGEAEPRTILAGIAESYEPEAVVGRSIVIVANLAPRPMMGLVSQGMVLAASVDGGPAMLINPDPAVPGTRVR